MTVTVLRPDELVPMRAASRVAASTLQAVGRMLRPGMSTADIDAFVRADTAQRGGVPSQLGYHGFPASVCTSINDVVCHGIPSKNVVLGPGDIINVDVTTLLDGYHGDTSRTFVVGAVPGAAGTRLAAVAEACLWAGIGCVRHGARLGDIGAAIVECASSSGCTVVRDYGGHGIGREMHMAPHVPHHGRPGRGLRLRAGMALTIEPMINAGSEHTCCDDDGWTVRTRDGSLSAQFEHTIVVTTDGCEVLTDVSAAGS